jgi:hypothetical protein
MKNTSLLLYLLLFFTVFTSANNCYTQISTSIEGIYGKEKTMISLVFDKEINDLVHFGGFAKTGSLTDFHYPTIVYEEETVATEGSSSSSNFPYGPLEYLSQSSADFISGTSRTKGWAIGGYISLNRSLSMYKKDWFFIRFDVEHLRLSDNYDFTWLKRTWNGLDFDKEIIRDQGIYNYHAIGIATRAGYKRILGKDKRFFAQANFGVSYYHPYYPEPMESGQSGYWTKTPFMGVEFEAGAGIGYFIKKKK